MLQIQVQFVECVSAVYCRYRRSLLQIQAQFGCSSPYAFVIVARPPPDQIPFATRSDSVRHPIRFRPLPVGGYGILPYPRSPLRDPPRSPHRGCSGLRCTNQAINQAINHQPTKQSTTNQPSNQPINHPTNQTPSNQPTKPPTTTPFNFTHQKQPYIQQKH